MKCEHRRSLVEVGAVGCATGVSGMRGFASFGKCFHRKACWL